MKNDSSQSEQNARKDETLESGDRIDKITISRTRVISARVEDEWEV